jgi:leader peptidase (prepilin peptidase)/N-methyltransferase
LGGVAGAGLERLIARERQHLQLPRPSNRVRIGRPLVFALLTCALTVSLYEAEVHGRCVDTPEVQPPDFAWQARAIYHAVLATLLLAATFIDLDCYVIPDVITVSGTFVGVLAAALIPDLQIAHLWVDWSFAIPQLRGPYIPEWYDRYRIAHALAWSLAGALAGAALTQLVRSLSSRVLGQQAMGLGDVTLMAMIGSYLGWQAVVLTFAVAPLTGLLIALVGKIAVNRPYLPYGPCLSAAALLVVFTWRWLWAETRLMFSDLFGLAILGGIGIVALAILLMLLRLYRSIPTGR